MWPVPYFNSVEGLQTRPNPTWCGLLTSLTESFGSICYGSLCVVPVSQMRPWLVKIQVNALFVCLAENAQIIIRNHPEIECFLNNTDRID